MKKEEAEITQRVRHKRKDIDEYRKAQDTAILKKDQEHYEELEEMKKKNI